MKGVQNQILKIISNKGVCDFKIHYNDCILDTDCQRNRNNTKDMIRYRYIIAKDIIKLNPHLFTDEKIFEGLL